MAKLTDPDSLNQNTEIVFDTGAKTIQLLVAGNLSTDGVTGQCVYSFCKEEWKTDTTLIKFPFPLVAITEQKFDLVNGWDWADTTTRNLIRDAGWCLRDSSNVSQEEYMGFVTLGSMGASDQVYYQQASNGASADIVLTGPANQAIKIYGDGSHGSFNYRSYFKCFVREQAKIYDQSELSAIGVTTLTYQVYAFPLGNSDDLKIEATDITIQTTTPYLGAQVDSGSNGVTTSGTGAFTSAGQNFLTTVSIGDYLAIDAGGDAGRYIVTATGSDTALTVSPVFPIGGTGITYHVNDVGMNIDYLAGTGFGNWTNSTVYAANAVVYDSTDTDRWYITPGGGTSNGTNVGNDSGITDWVAYSGERQIGPSWFAFNVIIDGNNALKQLIYEFAQYQLRQNLDIDEGTGSVTGKTADRLLRFVGDTLVTYNGVYIDNFSAVDTNAIEFYDVAGAKQTFPYVAAGSILFNEYLVSDANAIYHMYFTSVPSGTYGATSAILVNNNTGNPISGSVGGDPEIEFDFDYDNNVQGGRTAGTNAAVTVVAIGLDTGQFVKTTSTITRSTANTISLVAALERNYSNP